MYVAHAYVDNIYIYIYIYILYICFNGQLSLRMAIYLLLQAEEDNFLAWFGIVCSSWVACNQATSKRSLLLPDGDTSRDYIRQANCMASRILNCSGKHLKDWLHMHVIPEVALNSVEYMYILMGPI